MNAARPPTDDARRDLAALVALDDVPAEVADDVRDLMAGDPDFAVMVAQYRGVLGLLDDSLDAPAPPVGLEDRVVAAVRAERAASQATSATSGGGRPRWVPWIASAAAAVALVFGGTVLGATQLRGDDAPEGPPVEAVALDLLAQGVSGDLDLVSRGWGTEIMLSVDGTEALAEYAVLIVDADGREVSAGTFAGLDGRQVNCRMSSAVLRQEAARFEVRDTAGTAVLAAQLPARP